VSPGKVKLDPSDPKAKKLVAKMFRKRTKLFGNHYLLPTWVSLPPPVDLHVFVLDTTRTHENTGGALNFEIITVNNTHTQDWNYSEHEHKRAV
jgi:hypothetical protein